MITAKLIQRARMLPVMLMLLPGSVMAGQIKVYLDESRSQFVMADEMDCKVHRSKTGVTLGLSFGNLLFSVGPEITLGGEAKVKWEESVQGLVVRYEELCNRFNSGVLTKSEYDKRLSEIDALAKEAYEMQENSLKQVRGRSKGLFSELDRNDAAVNDKVDALSAKVQALGSMDEMH